MIRYQRLLLSGWPLLTLLLGANAAHAAQDSVWIGGCEHPVVFNRAGTLSQLRPASQVELEAFDPAFSTRAQKLDAAFVSDNLDLVMTYSHITAVLPAPAERLFERDFDLLKVVLREAIEAPNLPASVTGFKIGKIHDTANRLSYYTAWEQGDLGKVVTGELWVEIEDCIVKVTLVKKHANGTEDLEGLLEAVLPTATTSLRQPE